MAKLTLTDIAAGYALIATINANNAAIETALENTLSRDGTTPNTMSAALDMNSQNISNLATPSNASHAATKDYVDTIASALTVAGDFSEALPYDFTNNITFQSAAGIVVKGAVAADTVTILHDGTDGEISTVGAASLNIQDSVNDIELRVWDGTGAESIEISTDLTASRIIASEALTIGTTLGGTSFFITDNGAQSFKPMNITGQASEPTVAGGTGWWWVDSTNTYFNYMDGSGKVGMLHPIVTAVPNPATETRTSDTTLADSTYLTGMTLEAGEGYLIEGMLKYTQNVGNIKLSPVYTGTDAEFFWSLDIHDQTGTVDTLYLNASGGANTISTMTDTENSYVHVRGYIHTTTAGDFKLQWAQGTSSANVTTLRTGSWFKINKLPKV
jgi:hypothetical protein